jgi:hypothetical protein
MVWKIRSGADYILTIEERSSYFSVRCAKPFNRLAEPGHAPEGNRRKERCSDALPRQVGSLTGKWHFFDYRYAVNITSFSATNFL